MKKFIVYSCIGLGASIGLFLSFLVTVLVFQGMVFDEPWDLLWTGIFGIIGSLIGSAVGGLFAFYIAKHQLEQQAKREEQNLKSSQMTLAKLIVLELKTNRNEAEKIQNKIREDEYITVLAEALANNRNDVRESFIILNSSIELEYILQIRLNLHDPEYFKVHQSIQMLISLKKQLERLITFKEVNLIQSTIKQIRKTSGEFIKTVDNL